MEITVLVEKVAANGYRARATELPGVETEGETRDEVLAKLRPLIDARLAQGVEVVRLRVPEQSNPWLDMAGMFKDDPLFDEWQQAIAEYRRQVEDDPNYQ